MTAHAAIVVFIIETFELSHEVLEVVAPFLTTQRPFVVFLLAFFVSAAWTACQSAWMRAAPAGLSGKFHDLAHILRMNLHKDDPAAMVIRDFIIAAVWSGFTGINPQMRDAAKLRMRDLIKNDTEYGNLVTLGSQVEGEDQIAPIGTQTACRMLLKAEQKFAQTLRLQAKPKSDEFETAQGFLLHACCT